MTCLRVLWTQQLRPSDVHGKMPEGYEYAPSGGDKKPGTYGEGIGGELLTDPARKGRPVAEARERWFRQAPRGIGTPGIVGALQERAQLVFGHAAPLPNSAISSSAHCATGAASCAEKVRVSTLNLAAGTSGASL